MSKQIFLDNCPGDSVIAAAAAWLAKVNLISFLIPLPALAECQGLPLAKLQLQHWLCIIHRDTEMPSIFKKSPSLAVKPLVLLGRVWVFFPTERVNSSAY